MRYGSRRKTYRKNMIGEIKMNKAYKLLTAQEARRNARKTFIVDAVGWALLSLGTAVIALIVYTMAVVVLGGDL
jgi:predicted benzoate:H+ symporter BenE